MCKSIILYIVPLLISSPVVKNLLCAPRQKVFDYICKLFIYQVLQFLIKGISVVSDIKTSLNKEMIV